MTHQLEVRALTTGYGRIDVVRDVTVTAPHGTVVALLGPSGAGKTTTLRAVAGLLPVRAGSVWHAGRRIDGLGPHAIARRGVVLMPERDAVFTSLTVEENLRLGYETARLGRGPRGFRLAARLLSGGRDAGGHGPDGFAAARREAVAVFPQLAGLLGRRAATLSGGERQMLALARVFLTDPDVLLLDEMSMGLAPRVVEDLYEPVGRLRNRGVTVVLVEQDLQRVLTVADLCYVLVGGRVRLVAEPGELRSGAVTLPGYPGA